MSSFRFGHRSPLVRRSVKGHTVATAERCDICIWRYGHDNALRTKAKADVFGAVHERVQLCKVPQTEFAFASESLRVSKVNHIFQCTWPQCWAGVSRRDLSRLYRRECAGKDQWMLLAQNTSARWLRQDLGIKDIIRDATTAGLAASQALLTRLKDLVETASAAFLNAFEHSERATAHLYLQKAAKAADEAWEPNSALL